MLWQSRRTHHNVTASLGKLYSKLYGIVCLVCSVLSAAIYSDSAYTSNKTSTTPVEYDLIMASERRASLCIYAGSHC